MIRLRKRTSAAILGRHSIIMFIIEASPYAWNALALADIALASDSPSCLVLDAVALAIAIR
jgi:hypothetical protein